MKGENKSSTIEALEEQIVFINSQLADAKKSVEEWTEANASLSRSAAEARANNQGMGRGIMGGLLGSKYRGTMRRVAATSNAAIAKEVAEKRAKIAEGKRNSQELVRQLKAQLADANKELKSLTSGTRTKARTKSAKAKASAASLDLLKKLKEAHEAGLLSESEFESKRKKLIEEI